MSYRHCHITPSSPSPCAMIDQPHHPGRETEAHPVQGHDQATAFFEARSHYILHNEGSGTPGIPVETRQFEGSMEFEQSCNQSKDPLGMASGAMSSTAWRMPNHIGSHVLVVSGCTDGVWVGSRHMVSWSVVWMHQEVGGLTLGPSQVV